MSRRLIISGIVVVLLVLAWIVAPTVAVWSMALATSKGEESSQRAHDRIVFFGERAVPSVIRSIEKHSPWVRRYVYLPSALQKIGGSAKSQLLEAIGKQDDLHKRAYLIGALQSAFGDYRFLETVIDDVSSDRLEGGVLFHMGRDLKYEFPDAPDLLIDYVSINPAFEVYWRDRQLAD